MADRPPLLLDTNVIIEAVRTGCWAAIAGALPLESVETCRDEALAGGSHIRGYVRVTAAQLGRVVVRAVEPIGRATFLLHYPEADALDAGERDLWAFALSLPGDWEACCADKAAVRAAVRLGWGDRLRSLERLAERVGGRPAPALQPHFTERSLSAWRTQFLMEGR